MADNLIACHDKMTGSVGKERSVDANITCNFIKAFDTATHSILIAKLVRYKLGKWIISWMENWLNCWVALGCLRFSW